MKTKTYFLLILLAFSFFCCQKTEELLCDPTPEPPVILAPWVASTVKDTITDMAITAKAIWMTTKSNGIQKVDRSTLEVLNGSHRSIVWPDNMLTSILALDESNYWVGMRNGGLAKVMAAELRVFNSSNSTMPNSEVRCLELGADGSIWIGTFGGLVHYQDGVFKAYDSTNSILPDDNIRVIRKDARDNIWVGTQAGGLVRFNETEGEIFNKDNSILEDDQIRCISFAKDGTLWTASFFKPYYSSNGIWNFLDHTNSDLSSNYVNDVEISTDGIEYFATHNGFSINRAGTWANYYTWNSTLEHNIVERIIIDEYQNKWIGTYGGLVVYNEDGVRLLP